MSIPGCHWITVSNIGCCSEYVSICDSLLSIHVPGCTKEQISAMLFHKNELTCYIFQAVQLQHGTNDCGLFVLAFTTLLCAGESPVQMIYVQHWPCIQLLKCLLQQKQISFPQDSTEKEALTVPRDKSHSRSSVFVGCLKIDTV